MKEILNIMKFLERVELKWKEVPEFVECINYLNKLAGEQKENNKS